MKILLMEGDHDFVYMIKKILNREGHMVIGHNENEECFLKNENSRPDLFLIGDIDRGIHGCEVCSTIKEIYPKGNIPVIPILYDDFDIEVKIKDCIHNCDGYIVKPITKEKLINSINPIFST